MKTRCIMHISRDGPLCIGLAVLFVYGPPFSHKLCPMLGHFVLFAKLQLLFINLLCPAIPHPRMDNFTVLPSCGAESQGGSSCGICVSSVVSTCAGIFLLPSQPFLIETINLVLWLLFASAMPLAVHPKVMMQDTSTLPVPGSA